MWNTPTKDQLDKIPKIYTTDFIPIKHKKIFLHFFIGGCDWYVAEYDGDDQFFGFVILNDDFEMAEWGYFSFNDLKSIRIGYVEIDCDLYWQIKRASEIERIVQCRNGIL
ncbi:DUF2958 domain-containing protein [Desulfobacula sp.]|uniref:DUF2958 domain-containing protein n=1 Tax=Desulfobacula sp. TaxID=2593537 RepID=UPI00261BD94E|nr:DUF2958 domain-containing protein [Desulfobacula sp.]